jgi:hypothetical protein
MRTTSPGSATTSPRTMIPPHNSFASAPASAHSTTLAAPNPPLTGSRSPGYSSHSYSHSTSPSTASGSLPEIQNHEPSMMMISPTQISSASLNAQKRAYRQRRKDPSCDACRERKVKVRYYSVSWQASRSQGLVSLAPFLPKISQITWETFPMRASIHCTDSVMFYSLTYDFQTAWSKLHDHYSGQGTDSLYSAMPPKYPPAQSAQVVITNVSLRKRLIDACPQSSMAAHSKNTIYG